MNTDLTDEQLHTLKLLTIASICYYKNLEIIKKEMKNNKELIQLYMKLPTVQYTHNDIALSILANSDLDVNKITSIDDITNILSGGILNG